MSVFRVKVPATILSRPPVKAAKSLKRLWYSIRPFSSSMETTSPKLSSSRMVIVAVFSGLFRASTSLAAIQHTQASRMDTPMTATAYSIPELAAKLRERRRRSLLRRELWPSPERSAGVRELLLSCAIGSSSNQVCLQAQPQTMLSVSVSSRSTRLSWGSVGTLSWSTALRHMPTRKPLKCSSQRS